MKKESFTQFFYHFSWIHEVVKFWMIKLSRRKWCHTHECTKHFILGFLCMSLLILWKKNFLYSSQFFGHFDHFSWIHEVVKFWMIKLALDLLLKSKGSEIFFWTICSGVIVTYLVVGMYFSLSQIFFGMKLFVSIFVLSLFLSL